MFEAYRVGIRLSLVNGVTSGLISIISKFGVLHGDATKLQKTLGEIKVLGAAGGVMAGAGFMGLGLISKTIKPASEYAHQLVLMNSAGMKHLEIVEATKAAWAATKIVPTSSVSENLEAVRDLRMVFGDTAHATQFMPTLQKIQGVLSNVRHGVGEGGAKQEAYELAKALEMKGAVKTPTQFEGQADLMTKALISAGGKVRATDFLSAFKYGRAATSGWNDEFAYKILPTLIQEMKGGGGSATGGPGSALMSMYAAVVGGVISQRALGLWQQLGLVDPKKVVWSKDGHVKGVLPGGIKGSDIMQENPREFIRQVVQPALMTHGYTSEKQQKEAYQYLFPNRTAGFVATQFGLQDWKFERDKKLIEGAQGLSGYSEMMKNDPIMAQMALQKQWNSLLAILGFQIMPPFISGLQSLISTIRSASNFFKDHSTLAKTLAYGFTGLSAAMAFGGTVILLTAAFKGLGLFMPIFTNLGRMAIPLLVGSLVGKLGLVAAVGAASYAIGTMANDMINKFVKWMTKGKEDSLGGWLAGLVDRNRPDQLGWKGNTFVGIEKNPMWNPNTQGSTPQFITKNTAYNNPSSIDSRAFSSSSNTTKNTAYSNPSSIDSRAFSNVMSSPVTNSLLNTSLTNSLINNNSHTNLLDNDVINTINNNRNTDSSAVSTVNHNRNIANKNTNQSINPRIESIKPRITNKTIQVNSSINLDGRKIASVVTNHQASEMEQPHSGLGGMFDRMMSPVPVGY